MDQQKQKELQENLEKLRQGFENVGRGFSRTGSVFTTAGMHALFIALHLVLGLFSCGLSLIVTVPLHVLFTVVAGLGSRK